MRRKSKRSSSTLISALVRMDSELPVVDALFAAMRDVMERYIY